MKPDNIQRDVLHRKMDEAMDELLVQEAARLMRNKLAVARLKGRGGWWNPAECTVRGLQTMLEDHVDKGDPVDIMNIAAMIAFREITDFRDDIPVVPQPAPERRDQRI